MLSNRSRPCPAGITRAAATRPASSWRSRSRSWSMARAVSRSVPAWPPSTRCCRSSSPGDRIVVGKNIYGGTYSLFHEYFERWGVIVEEVDTTDYEALDAAVVRRIRQGQCARMSGQGRVLRSAHQPASASQQRDGHCRNRPPSWRDRHRRQHIRHPVSAAAARPRRRHRHPFRHQVSGRPFRSQRRPRGGQGR